MPASPPRVIATIDRLSDVAPALRRWFLDELGTTFEAVDELTGLPDRYCSKLLGAAPVRGLGSQSLPLLLQAAGLKLQLVVEEQQLAKVRHRLQPPAACAPFGASPGARSETLNRRHWRKQRPAA